MLNEVIGTRGNDTLVGNDTAGNILQGKAGDDVLVAYGLSDTLFGGKGVDTFELGGDGIAIIADFKVGETVRIDSIGISGNPVSGFAYREGGANAADKAKATVIYNDHNGKLFYDHDGKGGDAAVHIAYLSAGLNLSKSEFDVF